MMAATLQSRVLRLQIGHARPYQGVVLDLESAVPAPW